MTKTTDLLLETSERFGKALDRYYSDVMVDMILSTPGHSFLKAYENVKITWWDSFQSFLLEIRMRISYAVEALKGNYGEDYDY